MALLESDVGLLCYSLPSVIRGTLFGFPLNEERYFFVKKIFLYQRNAVESCEIEGNVSSTNP
jgi:hypothetical protein